MDIRLCPHCDRGEAPPAVRCSTCGAALELRDERWLVGKNLGNYRIERLLGSGGMGVVFGGRHQTLLREVAVKVLQPGLGTTGDTASSDGDAFARRFLREARLLAALDHPGIVGIYDFDLSPYGFPYLVMPLLRGETLRALLDRHPDGLARAWVAAILQDLAAALGHAHEQGIVHRDLKPENVFLGVEGGQARVRLLDFGIAHGGRRDALDRTATGVLMGTPMYLAPEQLRGEMVSAATDQYSLALLAIELIGGRALRAGDDITEIVRLYARDAVAETRLPENLAVPEREALLRATDPQPPARFASCSEFVAALGLPPPDRAGLARVLRLPPTENTDPAAGTVVLKTPDTTRPPPAVSPLRAGAPAASGHARDSVWPMRIAAALGVLLLVAASFWWLRREPGPVTQLAMPTTPAEAGGDWLRELDATPLAGALDVLAQKNQNLVIRQAGGWTLFDLATRTAAPGIALAPGERLLGADEDGALWLLHDARIDALDPATGTRTPVVDANPLLTDDAAADWRLARSGRWLARLDRDRLVVLRVVAGKVERLLETPASLGASLALGDRLALLAEPRGQLRAWDLDAGTLRWSTPLGAFRTNRLALAEDLGRIALATEEAVLVFRAEDGVQTDAASFVASRLLWFADGPRLVSANARETVVWHWRDGTIVRAQQLPGSDALLRGDTELLALGDGQLRRYAFGPPLPAVAVGVGQVWAAVAAADNFYLGGSEPALARLAVDGGLLHRSVHDAGIPDLRLHDGRLVSSSDDRTLAVWRLPELELQWRARGHEFFVNQLAVGGSLWSASSDGTLRRWRWPELEPAEDIAIGDRFSPRLELHGLWVAADDAELLVGSWGHRILHLRRDGANWSLASAPFEARTGYRLVDLPEAGAVLVVGIYPGRLALFDKAHGTLSDLPRDGRAWFAAVADGAGGVWLGGAAEIAHLRVTPRADGRFDIRQRIVSASAFGAIGAMALRAGSAQSPALLLLGNAAGNAILLPPPDGDAADIHLTSAAVRQFKPQR